MNQLDQLGMRISHIDSAFDQWIKQQNTNYNTFAVLYTLATEGSRTQKYIGEEWSLPKQTVSGTCKTLAEQGLLTFHESEQDKRERLLSLTELGYLSIGMAMSVLFGFAFIHMTLKGYGSAGHIYSVSTYLWMFAMSLDDVPRLVEQYSNLKDIGQRVELSEENNLSKAV